MMPSAVQQRGARTLRYNRRIRPVICIGARIDSGLENV